MSCQKSDPVLCAKDSGIARGQTLQIARRKDIVKSCFDVQKTILERDQHFFRHYFIRNGFGQYRYVESVSFCLNNLEICDKMYR